MNPDCFNSLYPSIRVAIASNGRRIFGPGTQELLEGIKKYGSVHRACEEMSMSYSKGRKILKNLEIRFKINMVDRYRGGIGGGRAQLTEAGIFLLETYNSYEADVNRYTEEKFSMYFSDIAKKLKTISELREKNETDKN